jgi:hypothetical protein
MSMKYLFINTAGAFSQDYKTHGFRGQGKIWEEYPITAKNVLLSEAPFSSKCVKACLDLGSRERSSCLWITKDKASKRLVCVSSLKGVVSAKRRDFTGRVIFDSVALISSCLIGSSEENETLLEHESIARGFAGATLDMSVALDGSANMEDFDKDAFPFSDVNAFFESLPSDIADLDMNSSTQDGLGSASSVINLLKELDITFSVRYQDPPSQDSRQYPAGTFGATRNTPPSDRKCLLDGAFEVVEAVEDKVEELASELVGEERAGSLFRPLKKLKGLFPGNLIKANRSVKRPSGEVQNTGAPTSKRSVLVNSATSTVVISSMPSPQLLSRLLHGMFIVASRAESVCIGFLIGGGDQPEMIYGTGKDPAELLLVLIRG